jgi:hypothetical protein
LASASSESPPSRGPRLPWSLLLVVLLAALPGLAAVPMLFRRGYSPGTDHALLELGARHVTAGVIEVGPYSRNGWFHPGPSIYYLIAGPYLVTGRHSIGILLGALIVNIAALVAIGIVVRRRAGTAAALASLGVLLVMLRAIPAPVLADPWNPYLPMLAFALLLVLGWSAVENHRHLPALPVLASICVQAHVGYLPPCVAVLGTVVVLLVLRRTRPRIGARSWASWGAVFVLVWILPVYQQLTGKDGNLAALWDYFRTGHSTLPWSLAWDVLVTELGRFPAYLLGVQPHPVYAVPSELPTWPAAITFLGFVASVLLAVRYRARAVLEFAALTVASWLAALVAVRQVSGLLFSYLVQWTSLTGAFAWITVVLGVSAAVRSRVPGESKPARWPASTAGRATITAIGAGGLLFVLALAVMVGVSAGRVRPENEPDAPPIASQLAGWLRTQPPGVAGIGYQTCVHPSFLCVAPAGRALVDQLVRRGVLVRPLDFDAWYFGPVLPPPRDQVTYRLLLGFSGGDSPPPPVGWRRVAESGHLIVYAAPTAPAGSGDH